MTSGQVLPSERSLTNATVGDASQLSSSSVTTFTSGAGTFAAHWTLTGAGSLAVGAVLSSTVMSWTPVLALPESSVAVQVRVTLYSCGHAPGVVTSAKVIVGEASQASRAVGAVKLGVVGHWMVAAAPSVLYLLISMGAFAWLVKYR